MQYEPESLCCCCFWPRATHRQLHQKVRTYCLMYIILFSRSFSECRSVCESDGGSNQTPRTWKIVTQRVFWESSLWQKNRFWIVLYYLVFFRIHSYNSIWSVSIRNVQDNVLRHSESHKSCNTQFTRTVFGGNDKNEAQCRYSINGILSLGRRKSTYSNTSAFEV